MTPPQRPGMGCKVRHPDFHKGMKLQAVGGQPANLPEAASQTDTFDVIFNQFGMGSCVAQGAAGACQQRAAMQGLQRREIARLPLYRSALIRDGSYPMDEGTYPETMLAVLSEEGFGPEELAPYADDYTALQRPPSAAYVAEARKWRLVAHNAIARDVPTIKSEIVAGHVPLISMVLHESFLRIGSDGVMPIPASSEAEIGGHLMRLAAYDRGGAIAANSWGRGFGRNGYVWIPWRLLEDPYHCRSVHSIQVVQHLPH